MQEQCKFKKQTNINIKYKFQTLLKSIKQPVIKYDQMIKLDHTIITDY